MEPLLSFAEELERRDAEVARALAGVERIQVEVEELRTHAAAVSRFLASLPALVERHDADARAAAEAREHAIASLALADAALERAGNEHDRLAAERDVQRRRDELRAADAWIAEARDARIQLDLDAGQAGVESVRLAERALALGPRVRDVPPPAPGLDGAAEWGSRARGALILVHSALARDRDEVVREASELVASVVGEPRLASGVAGVRDRLERALRGD